MADIDTVIADAKDYAGELLEEARDIVNDASRISQGRAFVNVQEISWTSDDDPESDYLEAEFPADYDGEYVPPEGGDGLSEDIEFQEAFLPNVPDIPDAPNVLNTSGLFNIPRPGWNIGDFNEPAPNVNTNVALPPDAVIDLPEAPDGAGSSLTAPTITPPTFDDQMDVPTIAEVDVTGGIATDFDTKRIQLAEVAQSAADAWMTKYCPGYDDGMAELEARIGTAMQGGSAMDEAWEDAIYDRANVRVNDQQHISQEALTKDYARRGFPIPPGAVMAGLSRIRHEQNRNLADVAGNIANERAKLELQHLQFGMQISTTLRQHFSSAMQNYMQLMFTANGQALQYAAEVGRWAAELFNQRVELYRLEQSRYQAEGQLYAVRLESSYAQLKQFEVQIEAEKLKIQVDNNEIQLYQARIQGELSKIDVYNSQLQGVRTLLEAEAQKISVFESQVRAYAARVSGKASEYDAYRAAIQGDAAKVDAYKAEVQAYSSSVSAVATTVDAERSIAQSVNDFNESLISQQDSAIKRYMTEITAESTRHQSTIEVHKLALTRYSADVEARLRLVTATLGKSQLELRADIARVTTNLSAQSTNVDGFIRSIDNQASITNAGGNIIGDMGSSVLTTNNTILSKEE